MNSDFCVAVHALVYLNRRGCVLSSEELARNINRLLEGEISTPYCRELPECDADVERDVPIPLERCEQCVLHWLRQPAEEVRGNET